MNMPSRLFLLLLLLALLGAPVCALGETARELTAGCVFTAPDGTRLSCLSDGRYDTRWSSKPGNGARLTVSLPAGAVCGGVYLQFLDHPSPFDVQIQNAQGKWETVASCETSYLTGYAAVPECAGPLRIVPTGGGRRLKLAQVRVFAPGDTPSFVQRWKPPCEKADLLVLAAHPDDEVLFMGGTIPTYAGERGLQVQVCHLVPASPQRRLELLDCLWTCGVRNYPDIGSFGDVYASSLHEMYRQKGWSRERVYRYVVGLVRRYRPEVVVTHDVNGEYGHGAHRVCADAMRACVSLAADPAFERAQAQELGAWQVQKLYLHLYPENEIILNWRTPLAAFDGRTAFDVAQEGFWCHVSQRSTEYAVEDWGPYDNARFGLAFSLVGEDVEKDDFLEHIDVAPQAPAAN